MNELQIAVEKLKEKISPPFGKYIDVDEGWYQIVIDCDKELTEIDSNYIVIQIKQKFAGLRYYFEQSDIYDGDALSKMNAVVKKYEAIAATTCEATGLPGVLMQSPYGWRKILNPEFAQTTPHLVRYSVVDHLKNRQP